MNKIDRRPDYKRIYQEAVKIYSRTEHFSWGPFDETFYSMRVFEMCKRLVRLSGSQAKVRNAVLLTAAILHDIGKAYLQEDKVFGSKRERKNAYTEWKKHPKLGMKPAAKILIHFGHSKSFIKEVCHLIEWHDERKLPPSEKTLELQILQDADFLADQGIEGFIRPCTYSGKFKHSLISLIRFTHKEFGKPAEVHRMNLQISKKIAVEKRLFERRLTAMLYKDIQSELLE